MSESFVKKWQILPKMSNIGMQGGGQTRGGSPQMGGGGRKT